MKIVLFLFKYNTLYEIVYQVNSIHGLLYTYSLFYHLAEMQFKKKSHSTKLKCYINFEIRYKKFYKIISRVFQCITFYGFAGQPTCYEFACPIGTVSCRKLMKSSLDRAFLDVAVSCRDDSSKWRNSCFFKISFLQITICIVYAVWMLLNIFLKNILQNNAWLYKIYVRAFF